MRCKTGIAVNSEWEPNQSDNVNTKRTAHGTHMNAGKSDRYFQVDASLKIGFGVKAKDETEAKYVAEKRLKAVLETSLGASGWTFKVSKVRERKPI